MKATLRVSILLNLALLGSLIFVLANQPREATTAASVITESKSSVQAAAAPATPAPSRLEPDPFRWSRLVSAKDYRVYIANLRAIGCPETTIEDIVRGDTERAFSWERKQLALDESGVGPWSRQAEIQLVSRLLGERLPAVGTAAREQSAGYETGNDTGNEAAETPSTQSADISIKEDNGGEVTQTTMPSKNADRAAPACPLFLQNVNWGALGFDAEQQAAIAQVRQQFLNGINGMNQNPDDPANQNAPSANPASDSTPLTPWQKALQNANDQLLGSLGGDGYEKYVQQQYLAWYQPQVATHVGDGNLTIDPDAFSVK